MLNLFQISTSALFTVGRALDTTGHNIANINTPGYSRQLVEPATKPSMLIQGLYIGSGVEVGQLRRSYDNLLTENLRDVTGRQNHTQTLSDMANKVDNLLADPSAGLSPIIDDFFKSAQGVANDPTSIAARQDFISNANAVVKRFNIQTERLDDLSNYVNDQITMQVDEINDFAAAIAKLNSDIVVANARGVTTNAKPNDLLDSRDEIVRQMAEKIGVQVFQQDDGIYNVFIGNGQSLVTETQTRKLVVVPNRFDPSKNEIALEQTLNSGNNSQIANISTPAPVIISGQITGGSLGGLLQFRREILEPTQNGLGRVVTSLAVAMNQQQQLGIDFNGQLGKDLFNLKAPKVFSHAQNKGSLQLSAKITDIAQLTTDDYQITVLERGYSITNLNNGTTTQANISMIENDDGTTSIELTPPVDGMTIIFDGGAGKSGDKFLIQPARVALGKIDVAIDDPFAIAAAAPIATRAEPGNIGTGKLALERVFDTKNPAFADSGALKPPILIRFDNPKSTGGDLTYSIYDNTDPSTPVLLQDYSNPEEIKPLQGIAYTPGEAQIIFPIGSVDYGYQVKLSGAPQPGDSFRIEYNSESQGDNRNMLQVMHWQDNRIIDKNTATFQGAYDRMVADVGASARRAELSNDAEENLLTQAQNAQQELSGVNLDEEAANLLKYQEAYQAAAQLISTADTLFQTMLSVVSR